GDRRRCGPRRSRRAGTGPGWPRARRGGEGGSRGCRRSQGERGRVASESRLAIRSSTSGLSSARVLGMTRNEVRRRAGRGLPSRTAGERPWTACERPAVATVRLRRPVLRGACARAKQRAGEDDGEEEDVPAPCPNARRLQPSLVRRVMADARPSKDGFPMRTHTLATLLALVGTLGLGACDKKDDEADAKKTDAKAADAKAADA